MFRVWFRLYWFGLYWFTVCSLDVFYWSEAARGFLVWKFGASMGHFESNFNPFRSNIRGFRKFWGVIYIIWYPNGPRNAPATDHCFRTFSAFNNFVAILAIFVFWPTTYNARWRHNPFEISKFSFNTIKMKWCGNISIIWNSIS